MEEFDYGNADYGGMVQPNQQHVAPCVKVVEWGFDTRGLRMFWLQKVFQDFNSRAEEGDRAITSTEIS